jgi:hypothetical protein
MSVTSTLFKLAKAMAKRSVRARMRRARRRSSLPRWPRR